MDRHMLRRLRARATEEREAARLAGDPRSAARHDELAGRYEDVVNAYSKLGIAS